MSWLSGYLGNQPSSNNGANSRPSRGVERVNYAENSEEEDLEEGLVFDSPLTSPTRPHQSPSVSPRRLLQPDPPTTPEALQSVTDKLKDLTHSSDEDAEIVVSGVVIGEIDSEVANQAIIMPAGAVVNFEDDNGEDTAGALREGIQAVAKVNWDDNDLKFELSDIDYLNNHASLVSICLYGLNQRRTTTLIIIP